MSKYKNPYTILEKVRKGEIKSYYDDEDQGLFGRLNFYKKPDLIRPHVHYIDEDRIDGVIDKYITDSQNVQAEYNNWVKQAAYTKLPEKRQPSLSEFTKKLHENYKELPEHLKYDIYKLYYHKVDKLEFEERTEKNKVRYRFLEKANNPVGKIMTEGSSLKSAIFARNMMMYYLMQITQMDYIDPDTSQEIKSGLDGSNEFDDQDSNLDKLFGNNNSKRMLDRMMDQAQDICKNLDSVIDSDVQQKLFDQANVTGGEIIAGKLDTDFVRTIAAKIANVNLALGSLKEKIKKLLDKSTSYFSAKKTTTYEDLFSSDNVAGLDEYEFLHPKLRKIFAEDITIKDTKSIGKIDLYIDISGSMSSECGVKDRDGNDIRKMEFAKAIAAKMRELDLLNDIYLFDNKVKKWKTDIISIAMIDGNGGTTIDNAVLSIEKKPVNALIITDAEDRCEIYSEKAFFIGIKGANFAHFNAKTIKQYSEGGQVVVFDGDRIYKVDEKGRTIM